METTEDLFKRLLIEALNRAAHTELTVDDITISNIYADNSHAPHANTAVVVSVKTQSNSIYKGSKVFYYTRRNVDGSEYNHYFELDYTKPFFTADHADELTTRTGIEVRPFNLVNRLVDETSTYLGAWDYTLNDSHEFFIGKYPMLTQGRYPAVATGVLEITDKPFPIVTNNDTYPVTLIINGVVATITDGMVIHGLTAGRYPFYFSGANIDAIATTQECRKLISFSSQFSDMWRTLNLTDVNLEEVGSNLAVGNYLTVGQFANMPKLTTVADDWGLGDKVDTEYTTLFVDCPVLTTVGRFNLGVDTRTLAKTTVKPLVKNTPKLKRWGVDYRSITNSNSVNDIIEAVGTDTLTGTTISDGLLRGVDITILPRFIKESKIAKLPAHWFGLNKNTITTIQGAVSGEVISIDNDLFSGFSVLAAVRNLLVGFKDVTTSVTLPPFLFRNAPSTLTELETVFSGLTIAEIGNTSIHGLQPTAVKRLFYKCDFKNTVRVNMWNITHTKAVKTTNLFALCTFDSLPVGNSIVPQTVGELDITGLLEGATIRNSKIPTGFFDGTNVTVMDLAFAAMNGGKDTVTIPNGLFRDLVNLKTCSGVFRGTRVAFSAGSIFPNVKDLTGGCLGAYIAGPTDSVLAGCTNTKNINAFFNGATLDDISDRTFIDCGNVETIDSLCENAVFNTQPPSNWFAGLKSVKRASQCFKESTVTVPENLFVGLNSCSSFIELFMNANVRLVGKVFVGLSATEFKGIFYNATVRGSLVDLFSSEQSHQQLDCTGLFQLTKFNNLSHGVMNIPANGVLDNLFTNSTNTRTLTVYEFCEWCGFGGDNVRSVDSVPTDWLVGVKWVQGTLVDLLTILLGHVPTEEELDKWKPSVLGSGIA